MKHSSKSHLEVLNNFQFHLFKELRRERDWWFGELINKCYFKENHPTTGTNYGLLISIDSSTKQQFRMIVQIEKNNDLLEHLKALEDLNTGIIEITEILNQLRTSEFYDDFEIGIGVVPNEKADNIRLYVGISNHFYEETLINLLSQTNIWFPPLDEKVNVIIDRIRMICTLNGVAKRFISPCGYMLYFHCNRPIDWQILEYILDGHSESAYKNIESTFGIIEMDFNLVQSFGWAIGILENGELGDLKLEIELDSEYLLSNIINSNQILLSQLDALNALLTSCDFEAIPHIIAYRFSNSGKVSSTAYFGVSSSEKLDADDIKIYLKGVSDYYDEMTSVLQKLDFLTYQAGVLNNAKSYSDNNLLLAERADIAPGQKVLDVGCGLAGPSLDIANSIDNLLIEGINLSNEQVIKAKQEVLKAGRQEIIKITCGDFHFLPYENDYFDTAIFLESAGYSYDLFSLFSESNRVLKPKGILYIKDIFQNSKVLNNQEQKKLESFNLTYKYRTKSMYHVVKILKACNFEILTVLDLSDSINFATFFKDRVDQNLNDPLILDYSTKHFGEIHQLPMHFGEIKARKKATK